MKRRAAVEPVIGHLAEHRMGRNHLKGRHGDRNNAVLAAAGFNFRHRAAQNFTVDYVNYPVLRQRLALLVSKLIF
jgi:hypothetical protein